MNKMIEMSKNDDFILLWCKNTFFIRSRNKDDNL